MGRRLHPIGIGLTALVALASTAASQQVPRVARVGLLCPLSCAGPGYSAVEDELRKLGWIEGQSLVFERRAAEGRYDQLAELATQLVRLKPDLIVTGGTLPTQLLASATSTIPIVFAYVRDPVGLGLVKSLAHPGGNVTGLTVGPDSRELIGKKVELLKELLPNARRIATFVNFSNTAASGAFRADVSIAAASRGLHVDLIEIRDGDEIADAIAGAKARGADALFVTDVDTIFTTPRNRIPDLAARIGIPAIYRLRDMVQLGGLMSYGPDLIAISRRGAQYVDRVLRGGNPSEMSVEQPTKYHLSINLKTAKALGLTIPPSLLARADEVIE